MSWVTVKRNSVKKVQSYLQFISIYVVHNCRQYNGEGYLFPYPNQCYEILDVFAQHASNLTLCSILNARPITVCERCVEQYVKFRDKYQELLNTTVNGTSCRSVFITHDRLNAVQEYHDNILSVWNKGKCNGNYFYYYILKHCISKQL